jgi:hypothetical protein
MAGAPALRAAAQPAPEGASFSAKNRRCPRHRRARGSILDPFKPRITRLLDTHPYSAQQILQRLREEGYSGGISLLRRYIHRIRPPRRPVYLKLHFAPGAGGRLL